MQLLLSSSFMAATNGATAARTTTTISVKLQRQAVEIKLGASKLDLLGKVPALSPLSSPSSLCCLRYARCAHLHISVSFSLSLLVSFRVSGSCLWCQTESKLQRSQFAKMSEVSCPPTVSCLSLSAPLLTASAEQSILSPDVNLCVFSWRSCLAKLKKKRTKIAIAFVLLAWFVFAFCSKLIAQTGGADKQRQQQQHRTCNWRKENREEKAILFPLSFCRKLLRTDCCLIEN